MDQKIAEAMAEVEAANVAVKEAAERLEAAVQELAFLLSGDAE
jgi:hypothetical protein